MLKCKSYKKYKGIYKPRCNGGSGCDACNEKHKEQLSVKKSNTCKSTQNSI